MIPRDRTRPASLIRLASECRMGSMICPSCRTMMIPPARPTINAADRMSFTPAINSFTILSAFSFAAKPESMPMARNRPEISGKYHPYPITPTMRNNIVKPNMVRIKK